VFTQTHLLLGAAVFARPGNRRTAVAGLTGALVPDADVWVMFLTERLQGSSGCEVFHYRYWMEPWTSLQMGLNSIPACLGLIAAGLGCLMVRDSRLRGVGGVLLVFAGSALLHVGADFLLHHDDARAQWMPFSDWVFRSPVSYWNPNHYGQLFMPLEIALGLTLAVVVGRRFRSARVWTGLVVLSLGYAGSFAAAAMSGGNHPRGPGSCEAIAAQDTDMRAADTSAAPQLPN